MIMFSDIGSETEYVLSVMTPPIALCTVTAETFIYGDDRIASAFGGGDEKRLPSLRTFSLALCNRLNHLRLFKG